MFLHDVLKGFPLLSSTPTACYLCELQQPDFLNTLTTVLMSTPLLIKVQALLRSPTLFSNYVVALQMDNPSASHTQVMQSLQTFLNQLPATTRLEIQRVFAEAEASDSMGT